MSPVEIQWSSEVPFEQRAVEREVPERPGVYEILQTEVYLRYNGSTRVLKIGRSDGSLRQEVTNHFIRHTVANRLMRIRNRHAGQVSVIFATLSEELAAQAESDLLRKFEDEYWDLPVLNSQRGYARNADGHYRKEN